MTRLTRPVVEDDHIRGRFGAPVTLVEYGDFECPHCRRAHPIVLKLVKQFGDQLCYVFRNFPLSEIHPHAEAAAEAAEAANELGGPEAYWEMHDTLFHNQDALEEQDLIQYARSAGLDADEFAEALESGEYAKRVRQDFMSGVRSGVNGTPTFFVNGERYDGDWTDVEEFASALTVGSPSP